MILAAGRGARMKKLTDTLPKPLIRVHGKPMIEYHLEQLAGAGIRDVVINLGWLGEKIEAALGDGARFGLKIHYSREGWPALESGGGLLHALPLLGAAPFVVVNGDVYTDYPLARLVERARQLPDGTLAHLVLTANPPQNPRGDFVLEGGKVGNAEAGRLTFTGLSVHRPELLAGSTPGHFPILPLWREAAARGQISGELFSGRWSDVGTPERLAELEEQLESRHGESAQGR